MSLRIKHLNADTSWLLVFSPPCAGENLKGTFPGTFTVLVDPWLSGPSKIWSSKFSLSHHTVPACVDSLAQLPEPDLVIISQDKPDHCNQGTLTQLAPSTNAIIVGTPAAAKKIKSWDHFDSGNVHALKRFDPKEDTVFRIAIPPFSPIGSPGEVTISLLANKVDVTGLHNAIGITYRAPSSALSKGNASCVNLPLTPPITPPESPDTRPIYPERPSTGSVRSYTPSITLLPSQMSSKEKALSIIYSPHGVGYGIVKPYATSHLLAEAALPLTALFHCFDKVSNPWYLGGNLSSGFVSGLEIAENLFARTMISSHDEEKQLAGISTMSLKVEKYRVDDIIQQLGLSTAPNGKPTSTCKTDIVDIGVGQDYFMQGK